MNNARSANPRVFAFRAVQYLQGGKKENREPIIRRAFLTTKLKDDDPYRKKGYKYFLDEYICSGSNIIHSYKPKYFKTKKEVEEYKRSRR